MGRWKLGFLERFWGNAKELPNGCWQWQRRLNGKGYGHAYVNRGKTMLAHRVAWELANAKEFVGRQTIDHLCRNRACVNPAHLEQVSHRENCLRGKGSKTHCKNGHEFTSENTRWYYPPGSKNIRRMCKACSKERRKCQTTR